MGYYDAPPADAGGIMALKDKFIVRLSSEQRQELEQLAATGERSAAIITRARILLKADAGADGWPDDRVAEALDISAATRATVAAIILLPKTSVDATSGHQAATLPLYEC